MQQDVKDLLKGIPFLGGGGPIPPSVADIPDQEEDHDFDWGSEEFDDDDNVVEDDDAHDEEDDGEGIELFAIPPSPVNNNNVSPRPPPPPPALIGGVIMELSIPTISAEEERKRLILLDALAQYKAHRRYLSSRKWKLVPFDGGDGISVFYLPADATDHGHRMTKATGTVIGKTADEIARRHRDTNKITRLRWDKDIFDIGPVGVVDANPSIGIALEVQWEVRQPYGAFLKREHVVFQWSQSKTCPRLFPKDENGDVISSGGSSDNSWIIITCSTSHHNRPVPAKSSDRISLLNVMTLEPLTPASGIDSILPIPRTSVTLMGWTHPQDSDVSLAQRVQFLQKVKF